jgi:hypothetical protein
MRRFLLLLLPALLLLEASGVLGLRLGGICLRSQSARCLLGTASRSKLYACDLQSA